MYVDEAICTATVWDFGKSAMAGQVAKFFGTSFLLVRQPKGIPALVVRRIGPKLDPSCPLFRKSELLNGLLSWSNLTSLN